MNNTQSFLFLRPLRVIAVCLMLVSLISLSIGNAEAPTLDLTSTPASDLHAFMDEINDVTNRYHSMPYDMESTLLSMVKECVTSYFDAQGIDISWAWIDYSYNKDGDLCTVKTHIDYRDANNKKQSPNVYALLFPMNDEYQIFHLTVGNDTLIDNRAELPNTIWYNKPEPVISSVTGLDLTNYSSEDLDSLLEQALTELENNHTAKSSVNDTVKSLTISATEEYFSNKETTVSWPWFNYSFSNDWGLYTMTAPITARNSAGSSDMDVYSEAYPINNQYTLIYLSAGDEVVLDIRNSVNVKEESSTSSPVNQDSASADTASPEEMGPAEEPVIMELGSRGDDVRVLQKCLIALGYLQGRPDGAYGNKTVTAVSAFQNAVGIEVTGSVTQTLFETIQRSAASIPPEPIKFTAVELYNKFDQNQVAAENELKGQTVVVTGKVCSIDSSIWGVYYVTLYADSWGLSTVYCYFDDDMKNDIARLTKDQKVTIQGICDGADIFGNPELKKCIIAG